MNPGAIAMTPALKSAIAHAYAVFAPYAHRFRAQVCTCPCCFIEADRARLLATPLHLIDGYLLDQYSWSAHGQDEDGPLSDDLRYLLPRYFELFAHNDPALHNAPACILMQLGRTPYRTAWPAAEVAAIDRYKEALLRACLANGAVAGGRGMRGAGGHHCALRIDSVIAMLVRAGWDAARIVDVWTTAPDPSAALHSRSCAFAFTPTRAAQGWTMPTSPANTSWPPMPSAPS